MNPTGYHVVNLALFIADCLLIWLVLKRLAIPGAFLAALLYAVHPVNVESVAWVSQHKNVLSLLFFLLSLLWFIKSEIARFCSAGQILAYVAWESGLHHWFRFQSLVLSQSSGIYARDA